MSGVPERLAPAARCFHTTPGLEQRLDLLLHLIEFSHQPVVLTGAEGAGKTALLSELLERAPSNWSVAVLDGEVAATVEAVALRLAEAWDLGVAAADDDPVRALATALAGWARRERVPLILLDDADRVQAALLVSTLGVVSRVEGRARPRLLLAGEPALEERLRSPPLRDLLAGLPHSLEVPPLEEGEVQAYLAARQEADGLAGVRLPGDALRRLHRETGGLPGPLYDRFVRAVAAVAAAEAEPARRVASAPTLGAPQARKYAVVMGFLALVFVGSLLVRGLAWREPVQQEGEPGSVLETLTLPPLGPAAPPPPTVVFPGQPAVAERAPSDAPSPEPPAATASAPGNEADALAGPGASPDSGATPAASGQSGAREGDDAGDAGGREGPSTAQVAGGRADASAAPVAGDDRAHPPEEAGATSAGADEGATEAGDREAPPAVAGREPLAAPGAPPAPEPTPAPEPGPAPSAPAGVPPPAAGTKTDLAWLHALPASDWVLQVFASDNPRAARDALTRHGIAGRARVIPTARDGAAWYVVVMGPWPDRPSASAALRGLPTGLRSQGPFPKRVGDLQQASRKPR